MAKKQKDLSTFVKVSGHHRKGHTRVRKGKVEHVKPAKISQYFRKKRRPKLSKNKKIEITEGKSKRLITEQEKMEINKPLQIQMDLESKPTSDTYQKELSNLLQMIHQISGMKESEERAAYLKELHLEKITQHEEKVKKYNDARKEAELKIKSLKEIKTALKTSDPSKLAFLQEDIYEELKDKVYAVEEINERIKEEERKRKEAIKKIYEKADTSGYKEDLAEIERELKKENKKRDTFYLNFIDDVNERLQDIKEEEDLSKLVLYDNLRFNIQEDKEHTVRIEDSEMSKILGEEFTAPVTSYEFDELSQEAKRRIIEIIKEEFKEEYIEKKQKDGNEQEKINNFLETFKDKREKKKKTKQRKLDKELGINTKIADEYDDLKAFDKKQKRLM